MLSYGGGGRAGGGRGQEEAHVIDRVHLQLNSELQPTLTVNTHACIGYTEQHNTVPFIQRPTGLRLCGAGIFCYCPDLTARTQTAQTEETDIQLQK